MRRLYRGCRPEAMTAVTSFAGAQTFAPERVVAIAGVRVGWQFKSHGTAIP